jgi:hypothetical protein
LVKARLWPSPAAYWMTSVGEKGVRKGSGLLFLRVWRLPSASRNSKNRLELDENERVRFIKAEALLSLTLFVLVHL